MTRQRLEFDYGDDDRMRRRLENVLMDSTAANVAFGRVEPAAPAARKPPKFYSGMKCTVCGKGKLRKADSRELSPGSDIQRIKLVCNAPDCKFNFGYFEVPRDECDLGKGRKDSH